MTDVVRRLRVQGKVQGVGFRWFVQEEARALGLRGWVRNTPNGDVVLEVGGAPEVVDGLMRAVALGPPASRVESLLAEPADAESSEALPTPFVVHR
jgi:acylphosphatase